MDKMTNVKALDYVLSSYAMPEDVKNKLTAMREQFAKKNTAIHKPTATQMENEGLKADILSALNGTAYTISELIKAVPSLADCSNQKVSAIVRQMVSDGKLVRNEVKHKAYFSVA